MARQGYGHPDPALSAAAETWARTARLREFRTRPARFALLLTAYAGLYFEPAWWTLAIVLAAAAILIIPLGRPWHVDVEAANLRARLDRETPGSAVPLTVTYRDRRPFLVEVVALVAFVAVVGYCLWYRQAPAHSLLNFLGLLAWAGWSHTYRRPGRPSITVAESGLTIGDRTLAWAEIAAVDVGPVRIPLARKVLAIRCFPANVYTMVGHLPTRERNRILTELDRGGGAFTLPVESLAGDWEAVVRSARAYLRFRAG